MLTRKQQREVERCSARLQRAAEIADQAYRDLRAVFPEYTTADRGTLSAAARATDEAKANAENFRYYEQRLIADQF